MRTLTRSCLPTTYRRTRQICALLLALGLLAGGLGTPRPARAQVPDDPPCRYDYTAPYHDISFMCVEVVLDHLAAPEAVPVQAGLAFDSDGTLYLARPASGAIWSVRDADGDRFMDDPQIVAEGLNLPITLTVHDDSLYVLTADQVLRLDRAPDAAWDAPVVLIDDLPVSTGFWPGSLAVGPDARLYLSLGAACNACVQTDERLGALLSYDLDGSDEQIVARGFRTAADFAWNPETGALWIADSGRVTPPNSDFQPRDELNHVAPGAHYGFPDCYGLALRDDSLPAPAENFCESTAVPRLSYPYQSNPTGLAFYDGPAFPRWQGDLIIVLNGSWNLPAPAGYAVLINGFEQGQPDGTETYIAPTNEPAAPVLTLSEYSITGRGFFPDHPYDVAVSPEGWIYVSMAEGRVYRFRPRPAAR